MMHCQDLLLSSDVVSVNILTFFLTDLCSVWKAPRTGSSPLSTININMRTGPSAPASLCK